MKTRLAILVALAATAGVSTGAYAQSEILHLVHRQGPVQQQLHRFCFLLNKAPLKGWR